MSDKHFDDSDKPLIVDLIKSHIETNGYAQVGWATKVIGDQRHKTFSVPQIDHRGYYKSIESLCTNDVKYISEAVPGNETDFYIKLNPSYSKLEMEMEDLSNRTKDYPETKQRAKTSIRLSWIAIGLSALTLLLRLMCKTPS